MLPTTWQLEDVEDVEDVEGLIRFVVERYLGRRGTYLRPELREDLDDYLLTRTWELYRRFDPSKASTSLTLSTYLSRRLTYACTDWYRRTFGDSRYTSTVELPLVFDLTVESDDLEPRGRAETARGRTPSPEGFPALDRRTRSEPGGGQRESPPPADDDLTARLEEAEAPFWRHVRDALAERHPAAGGDDTSSDAAPADLCV